MRGEQLKTALSDENCHAFEGEKRQRLQVDICSMSSFLTRNTRGEKQMRTDFHPADNSGLGGSVHHQRRAFISGS